MLETNPTRPDSTLTFIAAIPWSDARQSTPLADFRAIATMFRGDAPGCHRDFLASMTERTWARMQTNANLADLGGRHLQAWRSHQTIKTLDDYNALADRDGLPRIVIDPDVPDGIAILRSFGADGRPLSEVIMRVS